MCQTGGIRVRTQLSCAALAASVLMAGIAVDARSALADQGGLSFWLPGLMASLAAVPGEPGWSWLSARVSGGRLSAMRDLPAGRSLGDYGQRDFPLRPSSVTISL